MGKIELYIFFTTFPQIPVNMPLVEIAEDYWVRSDMIVRMKTKEYNGMTGISHSVAVHLDGGEEYTSFFDSREAARTFADTIAHATCSERPVTDR